MEIKAIIAIASLNIPKINIQLANGQCIILKSAPTMVNNIPKRNKTKGILYLLFIFFYLKFFSMALIISPAISF